MKNENAMSPAEREDSLQRIPLLSDYQTKEEYVEARKAAGLDCNQCGKLLLLHEARRRGPVLCSECTRPHCGAYTHSRMARCPQCGALHQVEQWARSVTWETPTTGTLYMQCSCQNIFNISVVAEFVFTSGELVNKTTEMPAPIEIPIQTEAQTGVQF